MNSAVGEEDLNASPRAETSADTNSRPDEPTPESFEATDTAEFNAPAIALLLLVSLLPFGSIPAAHLASSRNATGFFQYELPYYVANGRAAFERGNGVFYPNPFDCNASAPTIYAHWLPWLFGAATSPFQFDPGDVMLIATFAASVVFAWCTWRLVDFRVDEKSHRGPAFLLTMWGGGLLAVAGIVASLITRNFSGDGLLGFDPGRGLWFLNWGRNAIFPTEAIYHAIVASCWLAEIRNQRRLANVCLLLLATTHPWSGLELLLTINAWRWGRVVFNRINQQRPEWLQAIFSAGLLVAFLGYYKMWLPSFESHAALQSVWELDWSVSTLTAVLAWGPFLAIAAYRICELRRTQTFSTTDAFLLCACAVAIGLALHDRIIKPVQPLHFTRGYVWLPLWLFCLPTLMSFARTLAKNHRRTITWAVCGVLIFDNAAFCAVHVLRQNRGDDGFRLSTDDRTLLSQLHAEELTRGKIILSDDPTLNYLMPTYAAVRPWLGHQFNTPDFPDRQQQMDAVFADNGVSLKMIPADVDVLVLQSGRDTSALLKSANWRPLRLSNSSWTLWIRS